MQFAFACAEGQIKMKAKGQPTTALVALKSMQRGVNRPLDEGLAAEREVAMDVIGTETTANLIGVFFMNTALARDPGIVTTAQPRSIKRAGVLGSGLMGAGIATAHARSGFPCAMVDINEERLADGMSRARKVIEGRMEIGRASPADMVQLLSNLHTSTSHCVFTDCDMVVEAVTENESLKTEAYQHLPATIRDDAILAPNTSPTSFPRI